jgi:hypothetical protein
MYSSNVFFVPGRNLDDLVTMVTPMVTVRHTGQLVSGNISGGATGMTFVNNPSLNTVAFNGGAMLDLSNLVKLISPQFTSLQVSDFVGYTPQLPTFLPPESTGQAPEFIRGIQPARADALTNNASATGSYALSSSLNLTGSYMHGLLRFGKAYATPAFGGFFDTDWESGMAGLNLKASPSDTLMVNSTYSRATFSGQAAGTAGSFVMYGGTVGWSRILTPALTASVTAGGSVVDPGSVKEIWIYNGNAMLTWKGTPTVATLTYSRGVFPSYFAVSAPIVSDMIGVMVAHPLARNLSLSGNASYARSSSADKTVSLSFETYSAILGLSYRVTQTVTTSVSYSYSSYLSEFAGAQSQFNQHLAMFTITGAWPYKVE